MDVLEKGAFTSICLLDNCAINTVLPSLFLLQNVVSHSFELNNRVPYNTRAKIYFFINIEQFTLNVYLTSSEKLTIAVNIVKKLRNVRIS